MAGGTFPLPVACVGARSLVAPMLIMMGGGAIRRPPFVARPPALGRGRSIGSRLDPNSGGRSGPPGRLSAAGCPPRVLRAVDFRRGRSSLPPRRWRRAGLPRCGHNTIVPHVRAGLSARASDAAAAMNRAPAFASWPNALQGQSMAGGSAGGARGELPRLPRPPSPGPQNLARSNPLMLWLFPIFRARAGPCGPAGPRLRRPFLLGLLKAGHLLSFAALLYLLKRADVRFPGRDDEIRKNSLVCASCSYPKRSAEQGRKAAFWALSGQKSPRTTPKHLKPARIACIQRKHTRPGSLRTPAWDV